MLHHFVVFQIDHIVLKVFSVNLRSFISESCVASFSLQTSRSTLRFSIANYCSGVRANVGEDLGLGLTFCLVTVLAAVEAKEGSEGSTVAGGAEATDKLLVVDVDNVVEDTDEGRVGYSSYICRIWQGSQLGYRCWWWGLICYC